MLVIGDIFMAVFRVFLLKGLHAVHQAHGGDVRRVQEHVLHPGVARAANIQEHVRLVDGLGVRGCGLIGVGVHARADQQREVFLAAQRLPGKIITGKIRGDDAKAFLPVFRSRRAGGEQQAGQQKQR